MCSMETFTDWLDGELKARGWSRSEAARRSGLSASMFDKVINGHANPGHRFCEGVAHLFSLSTEEVFRRAGLLPPVPEETATSRELLAMFAQLGDEDQERVMVMVRALRDEERRVQSEPRTATT